MTFLGERLSATGEYVTVVHMCSEPKIPGGELTVSQPVTGNLYSVALTYADVLKKKHLALHREAGTEPCSMSVDPVSAIFKDGDHTVWIRADRHGLTGGTLPPT